MLRLIGIGLIFTIQFVLLAVLLPGDWLEHVHMKEREWLGELHTQPSYEAIIGRSIAWHHQALYESGFAESVEAFFFEGAGDDQSNPTRIERWLLSSGHEFNVYVANVMLRLASTSVWLPLFAVVFLPALWDGFMEWKRRQFSFQYASPITQRYAGLMVYGSLIVSFFLMLAPFPVFPGVIPTALVLSCSIIGMLLLSNLPKKV